MLDEAAGRVGAQTMKAHTHTSAHEQRRRVDEIRVVSYTAGPAVRWCQKFRLKATQKREWNPISTNGLVWNVPTYIMHIDVIAVCACVRHFLFNRIP